MGLSEANILISNVEIKAYLILHFQNELSEGEKIFPHKLQSLVDPLISVIPLSCINWKWNGCFIKLCFKDLEEIWNVMEKDSNLARELNYPIFIFPKYVQDLRNKNVRELHLDINLKRNLKKLSLDMKTTVI